MRIEGDLLGTEETVSANQLAQASNLLDLARGIGLYLIDHEGRTTLELPNYTYRNTTLKIPLVPGMRPRHAAMRPKATAQNLLRLIQSRPDLQKFKYRQLSPFDPENAPNLVDKIKSYIEKPTNFNFLYPARRSVVERIILGLEMRELLSLGIHFITSGPNQGKLQFIADPAEDSELGSSYADNTQDGCISYLPTENIFGKGTLQLDQIAANRRKIVRYVLEQHRRPIMFLYDKNLRSRYFWRLSCIDSYLHKKPYTKAKRNHISAPDPTEKSFALIFNAHNPVVFRRELIDNTSLAIRENTKTQQIIMEIQTNGQISRRVQITEADSNLPMLIASYLERSKQPITE